MSDADQYFGMALWYAFGRMDSGEYAQQDIRLDAFEFAESVKAVRERWNEYSVGMFESIQGQWANYVAKKSWREATPDERFRYLAGHKESLPLVYRETEHGLEVREK